MKFSLMFVSLIGAVLVANTNAQFSPLLPGFGLGFPGLPFFPATFGRVFQPFIPHIRPGLLFRGRLFMGMGLPIGKRDVEQQSEVVNSTVVVEHQEHENRTTCSISTSSNKIHCKGIEVLECPVVPKLGEIGEKLRLRLADLVARVETLHKNVQVIKLVSRKSSGKFTFVHPSTHHEQFVFLHADKALTEPGFFFQDTTCFQKLVTLVKSVHSERFRLSLSIN